MDRSFPTGFKWALYSLNICLGAYVLYCACTSMPPVLKAIWAL